MQIYHDCVVGDYVRPAEAHAEIEAKDKALIIRDGRVEEWKCVATNWKNKLEKTQADLTAAREEIAKLTAERDALQVQVDRYLGLLYEANPIVCSTLCPCTKKAGEEWTHVDLCEMIQDARKATNQGAGDRPDALPGGEVR